MAAPPPGIDKGKDSAKPVAPKSSAKPAADPDILKLVEFFVKTPIGDLPPDAIPAFLEVDPDSLPGKLRAPYMTRKEELLALKQIADSKKKPPLRRLGVEEPAECDFEDGSEARLKIFRQAGYADIAEDEEEFLMRKTDCTECELMVEFTLKIFIVPPKDKKGKPKRVHMLHERDPLWTLVGAYRQGNENPFGTNFFGTGGPKCR